MAENIASRVGRLVSGGFNALVNAVEDAAPITLMEEAIREVDSAIDEVRAELGQVIANKHLASKRLVEENRKHGDLSERIELAVKEGRDDLAEVAIAQQLDIEAKIPVLEAAIEDDAAKEKELESYVSALKAKRREMEEELLSFKAAQKASTGESRGSAKGSDVDGKMEKATAAFDRVINRSSGMPGMSGPEDRATAAQMAELEELSRKNAIKDRLARVKQESA